MRDDRQGRGHDVGCDVGMRLSDVAVWSCVSADGQRHYLTLAGRISLCVLSVPVGRACGQ